MTAIDEIKAHLHLIRCFADETHERNYGDKKLYIKQQADRIEALLSASPAGVVKPWRLDKALAGYETVMDGNHEAILRFASEDEFLFFIDAMAKGRIMSAIEPAGVGVETGGLLISRERLRQKIEASPDDFECEVRPALKGDEQ